MNCVDELESLEVELLDGEILRCSELRNRDNFSTGDRNVYGNWRVATNSNRLSPILMFHESMHDGFPLLITSKQLEPKDINYMVNALNLYFPDELNLFAF